MKVLIFGPYSLWTPHLETDLEIAELHLRAGDELTWFGCRRELGICEQNPSHRLRRCFKCMGRLKRGLGMLSGPVTEASHEQFLTDADRARVAALPTTFASKAELDALRLDEFDLGTAVLSSVIWVLRDVVVDMDARRDWIERFVRDAARVYLGVRNYLRRHATERVYVFNGRMAPMRAVLRACQELGVDCFIHERGCDLEHYSLTRNSLWHEIGACERRMRAAWASGAHTPEARQEIADGFYAERAKGRIGSWFSFTDDQVEGTLPPDFDPTRRNIALYTASEYEFAAIDREWASPFGDEPTATTLRLIERCRAEHPDIHIHLRLHPNPDGDDATSTAAHMAIDSPNVTVIAPDSDVCTYTLLRACEKVVVTGSTVGIEAAFWGKPSILAGRSMWEGLGSVYRPKTMDELVALVADPDLPALDREGARIFGYYMATHGERFEHFQPDGVSTGTFMGSRVRATPGYALLARLLRLKRVFETS